MYSKNIVIFVSQTNVHIIMNKQKRQKKLNYDDRIYIGISSDNKLKLKELARLNGLDMNKFMRKLINTQLEMFANQLTAFENKKKES